MWLTIVLKVTENEGFTLFLKDTFFKKPQDGGSIWLTSNHFRFKSRTNSWGNYYISVYYYYSCFISLVMNGKLSQLKKIFEILTSWLYPKFSFVFYVLLTALIITNSHMLAWIYFIFSKKRPKPNWKDFQYQIWQSVKRSRK